MVQEQMSVDEARILGVRLAEADYSETDVTNYLVDLGYEANGDTARQVRVGYWSVR